MALVITFLLGIGNFALQRAVLDSVRPAIDHLPPFLRRHTGRIMLVAEFAVLTGALLLVALGHPGWGLAYLGYSAINGGAGWLILRHRPR